MNTESTNLDPFVNKPSPPPSGTADGAICDAGPLPEREEIMLQPCRDFPRRLRIEWDRRNMLVVLSSPTHEWFMWNCAKHAEVTLVAHPEALRPDKLIYRLDAGESVFHISQQEFDTLVAKLQPRGVKVVRP